MSGLNKSDTPQPLPGGSILDRQVILKGGDQTLTCDIYEDPISDCQTSMSVVFAAAAVTWHGLPGSKPVFETARRVRAVYVSH